MKSGSRLQTCSVSHMRFHRCIHMSELIKLCILNTVSHVSISVSHICLYTKEAVKRKAIVEEKELNCCH